jgi:Leucine-rich repeat (LRR) protein
VGLNLRKSQVIDVAPLAGLSELERLDLRDTQVSDIQPLSESSRLFIRIETDLRAQQLRATLKTGSTVTLETLDSIEGDGERDDDGEFYFNHGTLFRSAITVTAITVTGAITPKFEFAHDNILPSNQQVTQVPNT